MIPTVRVEWRFVVPRVSRGREIEDRDVARTIVRWAERWLRQHGLSCASAPTIYWSDDQSDYFIRNQIEFRFVVSAR